MCGREKIENNIIKKKINLFFQTEGGDRRANVDHKTHYMNKDHLYLLIYSKADKEVQFLKLKILCT